MTYSNFSQSCLELAGHINALADTEEWQDFDVQLVIYLEQFAELESQLVGERHAVPLLMVTTEELDYLQHLQSLHNKILTHALWRKEQIVGELVLLQKNKQAAFSYQSN